MFEQKSGHFYGAADTKLTTTIIIYQEYCRISKLYNDTVAKGPERGQWEPGVYNWGAEHSLASAHTGDGGEAHCVPAWLRRGLPTHRLLILPGSLLRSALSPWV